MFLNKIHLKVRKDKNGWFQFSKGKFRLQLCGNSKLDGFYLKQYAEKCNKPNFMSDLTIILAEMEKDWASAFSLYELEDKQ